MTAQHLSQVQRNAGTLMARSTKVLVALALALVLPVQTLAVQMSSIQPGDVYYLLNLTSPNDRVVVKAVDHNRQLVKVQYYSSRGESVALRHIGVDRVHSVPP
jgi:hypothetical protein